MISIGKAEEGTGRDPAKTNPPVKRGHMPIFVHLTSERAGQRMKRSGIRDIRGVYCLPVVPNYYVSHQWLRELKRSGHRIIVGVYFSLTDEEIVWLGHFGGPHEEMAAAQAAGHVLHAPDGRGLEVIVPHAIRPADIRSVRPLRHVIGWRYKPDAHGGEPCGCPRCQRGAIKSRRIRAGYERWNDVYRKAPYHVRESAADSLLDLYQGDALTILAPLLPDEAIARAIAEHDT